MHNALKAASLEWAMEREGMQNTSALDGLTFELDGSRHALDGHARLTVKITTIAEVLRLELAGESSAEIEALFVHKGFGEGEAVDAVRHAKGSYNLNDAAPVVLARAAEYAAKPEYRSTDDEGWS